MYSTVQVGAKYSEGYRCYISNDQGQPISPFHDIPLYASEDKKVLNMVVEIPRNSNAKLEVSKDELMNPIKQDVKKGKLRFVKNCFPYAGYIWNYGAFPQTWESPMVADEGTGLPGDNDPIDVLEIGGSIAKIGEVKQVKVLGAMAMLDEGETDWKILAIDINDPLAEKLNDIDDVEALCPGMIEATRRWFRIYKVPDGKPMNIFAFNGEAKDRAYSEHLIEKVHQMWKDLITGKVPAQTEKYNISVTNRASTSPFTIRKEEEALLPSQSSSLSDAPLPESVNEWAYVRD